MQALLSRGSMQSSHGAAASSDNVDGGQSAADDAAPGSDSALTGLQDPDAARASGATTAIHAAAAPGANSAAVVDGAASAASSARAAREQPPPAADVGGDLGAEAVAYARAGEAAAVFEAPGAAAQEVRAYVACASRSALDPPFPHIFT